MRILLIISSLFIFFTGNILAQSDNKYLLNWQLIDYTVEENLPMIKKSIEAGANLNFRNENGATSLMIATEKSNLEIVKYFLSLKADPNIGTYDSFTPLMMSVFKGNLDITELLIQNKAEVNAKENYGASALFYAAAFGDFVMCDMLLFYGANPSLKTHDGSNLLHIAAFTNDTNLFQLFLDRELNINEVNSSLFTPLMIAIQNNFEMLSAFIMNKGANPNYTDTNGLGAITIAIYNKSQTIVNQIIERKDFTYISNAKLKFNPVIAAKITHQPGMVKQLKMKGLGVNRVFLMDEITFQFDYIPNFSDYFFRIGSGFHEMTSNLYFNMGYQNRFKGKQLYVNKDNYKYLLWEHRTNFDLNVSRNFRIGNIESKTFVSTGLDFILSYGYYDGLKEKLPTRYMVAPEVGVLYCNNYINLGLMYTYTSYNFVEIPNHRIKFSVIFKVPVFEKPNKYFLSWMQ